MTSAEFLSRFSNVKEIKPGHFLVSCSIHRPDNNPSVSVTEGQDRLLIYCRVGCSTRDVLRAVGLDYPDLFFDQPTSRTTSNKKSIPERANLNWRWPWRKQTNQIMLISETRAALAEDFLEQVKGIDPETLTDTDKDVLLEKIALAWSWLRLAENAAELCFQIASHWRREEARNG